jgi:hypothetical protein
LVSRLKDADGHERVNGSFGRTPSRPADDPSPKSLQITPRPRSAFISQESPLRVFHVVHVGSALSSFGGIADVNS